MPKRNEVAYDDEEHKNKREYMREYRKKQIYNEAISYLKRKTRLRSADLPLLLKTARQKLAYLKVVDTFDGDRAKAEEFLNEYVSI